MIFKVRKIIDVQTEEYKDLGEIESNIMLAPGQEITVKNKKYIIKSLFINNAKKDNGVRYLEV